jgi:hypothetical protein
VRHLISVSEWGFSTTVTAAALPTYRRRRHLRRSVAFWFSVHGIDAMIDELSSCRSFGQAVRVSHGSRRLQTAAAVDDIGYLLAGRPLTLWWPRWLQQVALAPASQVPRDNPFFRVVARTIRAAGDLNARSLAACGI